MNYQFTIPQSFPQLTVKELLEDYFLIPRKIRHFLRIKKHVLVNGETIHWQSLVQKGDLIQLIFDADDYPEKEMPAGDPSLVEELYQDEHVIIVNKPEGMKTHANEPTEIALLNHVSSYVGATCYVVHRLDKETSGAILFAKNPFILPILNRILEEKQIQREYWALIQGSLPQKSIIYKDKIGRNSLVKCQLKTGRTHQIRVHLSHHGHPIVGDPLYNPARGERLMLHAHRLTFTNPLTLETIQVEAPSKSFEEGLKA